MDGWMDELSQCTWQVISLCITLLHFLTLQCSASYLHQQSCHCLFYCPLEATGSLEFINTSSILGSSGICSVRDTKWLFYLLDDASQHSLVFPVLHAGTDWGKRPLRLQKEARGWRGADKDQQPQSADFHETFPMTRLLFEPHAVQTTKSWLLQPCVGMDSDDLNWVREGVVWRESLWYRTTIVRCSVWA